MPKAKKREPETKQVSFAIHGEGFTRLARERLLDDNPGSAWRIASGLIGHDDGAGQELSVALAILKGDKKLVGKNEMELVDEDPNVTKIHQERIAWLFAGRIKHQDKWYRPIAEVTSYGVRDLTNSRRIEVSRVPGQGFINREWHYCGEGEIAPLASTTESDCNVIFEACGELPHWMTPPRDFHAAVKQWRAAGRQLEERGHALWYTRYASKTLAQQRTMLDDDNEYDQWRDAEEEAQALAELDGNADLTNEERRIARVQQVDRMEDFDAELAFEEANRRRLIESYRKKILEQAGDDFLILAWGDEKDDNDEELAKAWGRQPVKAGSTKVPRAPFLHWAFDRMRQYDAFKPPWEPVSRVGMKMIGDNRYHTDWVIGAGFDPRDQNLYGGSPISKAALHLAWLQQERFSAETGVHVLVDGEPAVGLVEYGKPNTRGARGAIVVLPNLHPKYLDATANAAAVITEEGGKTAHLAQVGRERRLPIVRVPDARQKYQIGDQLVVNTTRRIIEHL